MSDTQPQKGDVVLHCAHAVCTDGWHWWKLYQLDFKRPDGTVGEAAWVVACEECFVACEGDPMKLKITGDGTWDGHPVSYVKRS